MRNNVLKIAALLLLMNTLVFCLISNSYSIQTLVIGGQKNQWTDWKYNNKYIGDKVIDYKTKPGWMMPQLVDSTKNISLSTIDNYSNNNSLLNHCLHPGRSTFKTSCKIYK